MISLTIPKMACGGCAKSITKIILDIDGNAQVNADPSTKKVQITSNMEESIFRTALSTAGYPADPE
ncbi:heavy-metal-associated domain-containing protein [Providencia vermicola]|uniref:Heavy-metal-associated domain-containing protein n=1 Tax=Providencia stuartii TaxID=588 RepID=A0ABD5L1P6_PROST|nr:MULTISPECIES: heavy-metal-associated domain-containing protein [Providencia]ELR5043477.1 heavy-metal-associated domain-containing protein [Providencia rettgeri]ELR5142033.1 heavy-metal-associated domain-containing protein [Providencia stuartii]ELR5291637.1 heavy-metal-associated domain-containing protein [Providencia stuartii]MCR4180713.1 heavy-metal-associated domain-containing protein [Providencia vermicola]URE78292.1 heavy-metal-associated domain-containing protein [Providencia stuartii]